LRLTIIFLVDSAILQEAAQKKIDLVGRLQGVLGGQVKPMVTQCDMRHLYNADPKDEEVILLAKKYERRRCNHHELEEPLTSYECISECVDPKGSATNKNRYVVATQDRRIRAHLRGIPGVPLIYVNKSVMILEPMATATEDLREREEKAKFKAGLKGRRSANTGQKRKREEDGNGPGQTNGSIEVQSTAESAHQKKKRRNGAKEPNPLSIRKPKKPSATQEQDHRAAKPNNSSEEVSRQLADDSTETPMPDGTDAGKRKRKRKHKPKGEDVGSTHPEEGTLDT
jgi:U3 small nucleolar RNA-associated protein 23